MVRRSTGRTLLLAAAFVFLFLLITWSRIRTVESLPDQGYFDKYPYLADLLLAGRLSADRFTDASPAYLGLMALLRDQLGLDVLTIRSLQIGLTTIAALVCAAAGGWLGGPVAAAAAAVVIVGNRAALVNATELEPETLILFLNAAAILLLAGWQKTSRRGFLVGAALLLGLSVITRPTATLAIIMLAGWLLFRQRDRARLSAVFLLAGFTPVLLLLLANLVSGRPAVIMDPGTVFYEGMNPLATGYGGVQPQIVNDLERLTPARDALHITYRVVASRALGRPLSKGESNRYWTGKAIAFARTYPARALRLVLRKAALAIHSYEPYDLLTMVRKDWELQRQLWLPFGVALALGVAGAVLRREIAGPLVLLTIAFAIPLVLFYVTARQRNALLPSLAVLAGLGAGAIANSWRRDRRIVILTAVGVIVTGSVLGYEGHLQREDRHGWLSKFAADELRQRASTISEASQAELVRAHAATWLTTEVPEVPCEQIAPAAIDELKRAQTSARLFDLAVILGWCEWWGPADTILASLDLEGYAPIRDTRTPSSIAYHRALARLAGSERESSVRLLGQALCEAPGDAHVLALHSVVLGARDGTESRRILNELHDPFTRDFALGKAFSEVGKTSEAMAMLRRLKSSAPEWFRPRQLAARRGHR